MEAKAKQVNVWRIVAIAALVLCLILGALYAAGQLKKEKTAEEQPAVSEQPVQKTEEKVPEAAPTEEPVSKEEALSLWTDDAPAKEMLVSYMDAITKEGGEDYIPVENRIAVFDLDGTLFCETDPNYFDYTLLVYRVLEDPDYKDQASDFEKEVANKIVEQNRTGASFSGLEVDHGKAVASAFSGLTSSLKRTGQMSTSSLFPSNRKRLSFCRARSGIEQFDIVQNFNNLPPLLEAGLFFL